MAVEMIDKRIGNKFWLARSRSGRFKTFESAEAMQEACIEYFNWVDDNPLYEQKAHTMMGVIDYSETRKMRAMTLDGLTRFIGITRMTWKRWRDGEHGDDWAAVTDWAEGVIRDQKFTGAAAYLLNSTIISRDLGLTDKQSINNTGTITQIQYTAEDYKKAQSELDLELGGLD